jgi:nicotinic acid mononucleotide adenylyltransferase
MAPLLPGEDAPLYIAPSGVMDPAARWDAFNPTAILPGAFNPLHQGHRGLADAASALLGRVVAFELSIANVDKPPLDATEVQHRATQLVGQRGLWLTRAPRFIDKARLFPGAMFVVGADTAARVVHPRYYGDDASMLAALSLLSEQGCQFHVACRVDSAGHCIQLADLQVPRAFCNLFVAIPPEVFRLDISSTAIRCASPLQAEEAAG